MKKTDVYYTHHHGAIAQLARASHWQCEGREFESLLLHQASQRQPNFFGCLFYARASHRRRPERKLATAKVKPATA